MQDMQNEALFEIDCQVLRVSKKTLFRKKIFKGMSEEDVSNKAYLLGWRWDPMISKYYRIIGY